MSEEKNVLVVEDNDFVRMQLVGFLQSASYATLEAANGQEALDVMLSNKGVTLAVVDIRMEPMGGFDFVRELRSRNIEAPVIFVTGDQTSDILEQTGKLGATAVMMKPVEKDRLIKTVERTISMIERAS